MRRLPWWVFLTAGPVAVAILLSPLIFAAVSNRLDQPRRVTGQFRFLKRSFDAVRPHSKGVLLTRSRRSNSPLLVGEGSKVLPSDKLVLLRFGSHFRLSDPHASATYRIVRHERLGVVVHCDASSMINGVRRSLCHDIFLAWK